MSESENSKPDYNKPVQVTNNSVTVPDWFKEQTKRNELTTIVAGYMLATLESVRHSGQVSETVIERLDEALAYVRPVVAEIMRLPKDSPEAPERLSEPPDL